jgi:YHS domain-containing protein
LFIGLLLFIVYRIIVSLSSPKKPLAKPGESHGSAGIATYRDPVCGVYVSEETAVIGRHDGQRHYFCSMDCLEKYREQLDHSSPS